MLHRLTIICPAAHVSDANHLAMVLGESAADGMTYGATEWQDGDGNLYAIASLPVSDAFLGAAVNALSRPSWDTENISMAAATRAQAKVVIWGLVEEDNPTPSPNVILAMFDVNPKELLAALGIGKVTA